VHHVALDEDWTLPVFGGGRSQKGEIKPGPKELSFVGVVFALTEVLSFAAGLAYRDVLKPAAVIRLQLHGAAGRRLTAPPERIFRKTYEASVDVIPWSATLLDAELIARAPDLAIDAAVHLFERFGWHDVPRWQLEADQRRLLERRL
jgi:hypothetical protein